MGDEAPVTFKEAWKGVPGAPPPPPEEGEGTGKEAEDDAAPAAAAAAGRGGKNWLQALLYVAIKSSSYSRSSSLLVIVFPLLWSSLSTQ
jgi:hypothetical protein